MKQRRSRRAAAATEQLQLPESVLVQILQHVDLYARLQDCALVSRAWASAAAAATTEIHVVVEDYIKMGGDRAGKCDSLSCWLQQHGGQVTSIKAVNGFGDPYVEDVLVFPVAKLTNLESLTVQGFNVQFSAADGNAAVSPNCGKDQRNKQTQHASKSRRRTHAHLPVPAAADAAAASAMQAADAVVLLPCLQELRLLRCTITDNTLQLLPQLPKLAKLALSADPSTTDSTVSTRMHELLQKLPSLQDLHLSCAGMPARGLHAVSALHRLQCLDLAVPDIKQQNQHGQQDSAYFTVLANLPSRLTELHLRPEPLRQSAGSSDHEDCTNLAEVQLLQGLTQLQLLEIEELLIDPTRLSALDASALTCLKLYNVIGRPAQDGPALLSALASLTALKHLGLIDNFWDAPLPVEQFASITAATGLTALCLVDCSQQPLPLGALQHILPSGKRLPHLRSLNIACAAEPASLAAATALAQLDNLPWCLDTKDVTSIVDSCPALQELQLWNVVRPSADVKILARLQSSLERLWVAGPAFKLAAARAVGQLTRLEELTWADSSFTESAIRAFTSLTALKQLEMFRCSLPESVTSTRPPSRAYTSFAPELLRSEFKLHALPGRPPLWQQLLTVFAEVDARKSRRPSRKDSKQSATNRTRKAKQPKASAKKAASRRS